MPRNGHYFCCKQHVVAFNAGQGRVGRGKLPVRRRPPSVESDEEDAAPPKEAAPPKGKRKASVVAADASRPS
eukprot:2731845-Prymnesium_polylepis.1